jgi:hypothetical protein
LEKEVISINGSSSEAVRHIHNRMPVILT